MSIKQRAEAAQEDADTNKAGAAEWKGLMLHNKLQCEQQRASVSGAFQQESDAGRLSQRQVDDYLTLMSLGDGQMQAALQRANEGDEFRAAGDALYQQAVDAYATGSGTSSDGYSLAMDLWDSAALAYSRASQRYRAAIDDHYRIALDHYKAALAVIYPQ